MASERTKKGINEKRKEHLLFSFWAGIRKWRGETDFREIVSNFSLEFPAFGPSVPDEPRGKVTLRYKGYEWTPVLWSFDNSER